MFNYVLTGKTIASKDCRYGQACYAVDGCVFPECAMDRIDYPTEQEARSAALQMGLIPEVAPAAVVIWTTGFHTFAVLREDGNRLNYQLVNGMWELIK